MNRTIYRKMKAEDVDAVAQIEQDTFPQPWSKQAFKTEIRENNIAYYIVAEKDGKIIGYGGLWHIINEMHITNIAVDKEHRDCGVGQGLVSHLLDAAKEDEHVTDISLEVRRSNFAAQSLYRKYGFSVIGVREKYYENDREDAYIMQKIIKR